MIQYQAFIFKSYDFNPESKTLSLNYSYDSELHFTETYEFDFEFASYDPFALDRALQNLFFMAGVSYYKAFLAPSIAVESGKIYQSLAEFLNKTYQRGLGEFFYVNQLDPRTEISFPVTASESLNMLSISGEGQLVGLGGGKDSIVSIEILRSQPKVATWSLNHRDQLEPLVDRIGLPHFQVHRSWDTQLKTLNEQGALNGHVPISAIFACVGTVVAVLTGYRDVVVSNESSASEPTLEYQGLDINHQYSKSLEFEQDYQTVLAAQYGDTSRYYSLLRPLSELHICKLFAQHFGTYAGVFSSCNRAYVHGSNHMSWCGECAKCAFVFLALTPFIERAQLESLWGKNLLLDPVHDQTYRQLLGIEGDKPLDCVGEIKESRAAMRLAQAQYPELVERFTFDIPGGYDWQALSPASMPADMRDLLQKAL